MTLRRSRRMVVLLGSVATAWISATCKDEAPPVPTTVAVNPTNVSFTSLNQTQQLTATVFDQQGRVMADAGVAWATTNVAVVGVTASGLATAAGSGSAEVLAVAGSAVGTVPVTVTQVPARIAVFAGNHQTGLAGFALNVSPAVVVRDALNNPVNGVTVDFAVATGGGSVTGGTATTSASGVARLGSWTVQLGANTLTATAAGSGITGNPLTFNATGVPSSYNIDVRPLTALTGPQQAAFDNAAATWQTLVYGDISDLFIDSIAAGTCGSNSPAIVRETIDDLIIFATVDSIDGPLGIVGQAGPCWIRVPGFLPLIGGMRFDSADLAFLQANNLLEPVILHEMGHVLGYGTLWSDLLDLIVDPVSQGGVDPHFIGAQALAAFDRIGGSGYTASAKVPVENMYGPGSADAHWRESVFDRELMTSLIDGGFNPLSVVTVASMGDEGYTVNYAGADAFGLSFPALLGVRAPGIELKDDIAKGPIYLIDRRGRIVRVLGP